MQRLEVSVAVQLIYKSLGVKGLRNAWPLKDGTDELSWKVVS